MSRRIITIDGPAGAGKGTVAKIVGEKLHLIQLDSGALYRLLTYYFLEKFTDITHIHQDDLVAELHTIRVQLNIEKNTIKWLINDRLVGKEIYESHISMHTAHFSKLIPIREKVNILLRELSQDHDIIIDGRDMGSVVFPQADLKIYLDAAPEIRAERRLLQLKAKGEDISYTEILRQTMERDDMDRKKEFGALKIPEAAHIIDSSNLSIEATAEAIINAYQKL